ncbi:MAG: DUF3108 domain-containing protein [Rubrivivax sp.]|nr:MAG: DUF3108 domain-containing protein [Rubrivivax sp.]
MASVMAPSPARGPTARRRSIMLGVIVGAVVLVHAWITREVITQLEEAALGSQASAIRRMNADLVADMQLTDPPIMAAPPPTVPAVETPALTPMVTDAASAASQPASRASAPEPAGSAPGTAEARASAASVDVSQGSGSAGIAGLATSADEAASSATTLAGLDTSAQAAEPSSLASAPSPASSAASAPAFEWPLATRVTFKLEGHVRGPVYGDAMVEWVRQGQRYQVHIDASIGPSFAPIGSQRWTSEGLITPQGLKPERFEAINKLLIKSSRPRIVGFEADEVVLADGKRVPRMPGVQDPASHYIQMAYEFILNPRLLRVGETVSIPLARTQHQEMVIYDIVGEEALDTPLGKVGTFRLRPRPLTDQKNDLLGEVWIAPSLQYLPIRMLITQGEKNFLDMKMSRAPQQASAGGTQAVPASASSQNSPPALDP